MAAQTSYSWSQRRRARTIFTTPRPCWRPSPTSTLPWDKRSASPPAPRMLTCRHKTLTFSLGSGAPTNATINPVNGLFNWTPTAAQTSGTNIITVVVTDNGVPPLSSTQSFTVTMYLPPQITGANVNGSQFTLSWQTVPGQTYQIEYKDDLTSPTWISSGSSLAGTGGTLSVTNDITQSAQRFFRIVAQ